MSRLLQPEEVETFRLLLKGYQLRQDYMDVFNGSNFAVITGPAGAGKDTLRETLIANYPEQYMPILSTTTRPLREGEQDGVTYHFKEIEDVEAGLREQQFFQAELIHNQQVSCLDIKEIHKLESEQCGLSILITKTEKQLAAIKSDIKTVFLIPPTIEVLMSRMQSERLLDDTELARRLESAAIEIEDALRSDNYYCLISDTVDHVLERSHSFFKGGYADPAYDQEARTVAKQILDNLSDW